MYRKYIKRIFDILISGAGIILFSPIIFVIMIGIKLDDKGTIFFFQDRMGKDGKLFKIIKFRTMIENAENMGSGLDNYADDYRVTKIGKFLRNTSLDEIPQLFNILNN